MKQAALPVILTFSAIVEAIGRRVRPRDVATKIDGLAFKLEQSLRVSRLPYHLLVCRR